jgi:hypothetical protein
LLLTGSREVKVTDDLIVDGWNLFVAHRLRHTHDFISNLSNNGIDSSIGFGHFPNENSSKKTILFFVGWTKFVESLLPRPCRKNNHLTGRGGCRSEASTLSNRAPD